MLILLCVIFTLGPGLIEQFLFGALLVIKQKEKESLGIVY